MLSERTLFYPQWMGKRYVPSLPAAVAEFFDELWSKHYQEAGVPFAWFAWFAVKDPCLSVSTRRARARPPCQRPSRHVAAAGQWLNRRFVKKQDTFCPKRHFPSSVFINTAFVFGNTVILFVITETVFASKGFVFANRTFVWINRVAVFASSIVVFAFTMIVFGNTGIVSRITKALFASGNIVFAIRPFVPAIKSFRAPVK